jgi:hypothetical protein
LLMMSSTGWTLVASGTKLHLRFRDFGGEACTPSTEKKTSAVKVLGSTATWRSPALRFCQCRSGCWKAVSSDAGGLPSTLPMPGGLDRSRCGLGRAARWVLVSVRLAGQHPCVENVLDRIVGTNLGTLELGWGRISHRPGRRETADRGADRRPDPQADL